MSRNSSRRQDQDKWALHLQQRFAAAQAAGKFEGKIAAIEVPDRKGTTIFNKDEHNRPETTPESLAKLKSAFRQDGSSTVGSAPGLNTGAAVLNWPRGRCIR